MKFKVKPEFEPCPEYEGRAVCVDITDPEERDSPWGAKEKFKVAFELDMEREDPPEGYCRNWVVHSLPFTVSLGEKSGFRKFLFQWLGRSLTKDEIANFDTDELIGMPAQITIGHHTAEDGTVYPRILACRPYRGQDPFQASGTYTPERDRKDEEKGTGSRKGASYRSAGTNQPPKSTKTPTVDDARKNPGKIRLHLGPGKGQELSDFSREDIENLIAKFLLRDFPKLKKPTADDQRLKAALETFRKRFKEEDAAAAGGGDGEGEGEEEAEPAALGSDY